MPPIGETLREARLRQKLGIADLEERTKIRAKYLRALENEEWGLLPGPTFVKTFLRTYAEVVGVDPHLLVEEFRANHEPHEELDPTPVGGGGGTARRETRRRAPPNPPRRGALVAGLALALVGFLLVLGLLGGDDDEPPPPSAGSGETSPRKTTETTPRPRPGRERRPAPVMGVAVRIEPETPTYACLDTGAGSDILFEGILEEGRTFKDPRRLRLNLGKRAVGLRVNGEPVTIEPSPEPVGFALSPTGAREIPEESRPCV
ncbi:MAG: helix-turn-helix domain-containing protein [Thermoleophilaceae bacterium]